MGQQARRALLGPNAPVSPWYPLSGIHPAAVFKKSPNLKVVACRFGSPRTVSLLPEQRYPPKLDSLCNSTTFLNAAPGLCAVLPSLPGRIRRASDVSLRALHAHSGDSLFTFPPVSCTI